LKDRDGNRIETPEGINRRWVEHFSGIEAGKNASAQDIIDAVITAENRKAGLTIVGKLVEMPSRVRLFQGIRKSKPHAAPGPDLIGPGIYRHQNAIAWSVEQQLRWRRSKHPLCERHCKSVEVRSSRFGKSRLVLQCV